MEETITEFKLMPYFEKGEVWFDIGDHEEISLSRQELQQLIDFIDKQENKTK